METWLDLSQFVINMKKVCVLDTDFALGHNLTMVAKTYFGVFYKFMEYHELDRYFTVLQLLDKVGEPYNQQALADGLKLDKVSMVRILDYLDVRGYIVRITNPEDRREKYVHLTDYGKEKIGEIHEQVKLMNEKVMEGIPEAKQLELFDMLKQIQSNINQLPANPVIINFKNKGKKKVYARQK